MRFFLPHISFCCCCLFCFFTHRHWHFQTIDSLMDWRIIQHNLYYYMMPVKRLSEYFHLWENQMKIGYCYFIISLSYYHQAEHWEHANTFNENEIQKKTFIFDSLGFGPCVIKPQAAHNIQLEIQWLTHWHLNEIIFFFLSFWTCPKIYNTPEKKMCYHLAITHPFHLQK